MAARKNLESKENWVLTIKNLRNGEYNCLMKNIKGGYYWHTPDYDGLFAYGATQDFNQKNLDFSIENKICKVIKSKFFNLEKED